MKKKIFLAGIAVMGSLFTKAQDIHFSQFYETAILRNPALTGIFTEEYKLTGFYREQWSSISSPYRTGMVSGQMRIGLNNEVQDHVSIGLLGFSDKAGSIDLKTTGFYGAVNYNKSLEDGHSSYLSVGFTGGFLQRSFDVGKMTFDNQYQGGIVLPSGNPGEEIPNPNFSHFDLGAGVSFNSSLGENNQNSYFIGISGYHFTKPKQVFYTNGTLVSLQTRYNVNLGLKFGLGDDWNSFLHGNYMMQGGYTEIIFGGLLRWNQFSSFNERNFSISAGAFYRYQDAVIPTVNIYYKGQTIGLSYDINTSSLKLHLRCGAVLRL